MISKYLFPLFTITRLAEETNAYSCGWVSKTDEWENPFFFQSVIYAIPLLPIRNMNHSREEHSVSRERTIGMLLSERQQQAIYRMKRENMLSHTASGVMYVKPIAGLG